MADQFSRLQDCPLDGECPVTCRSVFDRVVVTHGIQLTTRVMWELLDTFTDPGPLEFQLQVGTTNNNDADDWEDVGLPVTDVYYAEDAQQRVWGKTNWTHYRVKLSTSLGTYLSDPVHGLGILDRRSWRIAREKIRQKLKAFRVGTAGQRGYLLKRRITGEDCPRCLDPMTKEVRDPDCPVCFGTGKKCGYFYPMSCVWAEIAPKAHRIHLDGGQLRGTINDIAVWAEMLMTYMMSENDVWVADKTDDRYFVHHIQHTDEVRGVPILGAVELRPIPFSSMIYSIQIPDQLRTHGVDND